MAKTKDSIRMIQGRMFDMRILEQRNEYSGIMGRLKGKPQKSVRKQLIEASDYIH